jgi:hypothetical protein
MNKKYNSAYYDILRSVKSDKDVAYELSVHVRTVQNWRRKIHVRGAVKSNRLDYAPIDQMIQEGRSVRYISEKCHCAPSSVKKRRMELQGRSREKYDYVHGEVDTAPLIGPTDRLEVSVERKRKVLGLTHERMQVWLCGLAGRQFISDGNFMVMR